MTADTCVVNLSPHLLSSGKSTVVSAIGIALAGDTKSVGRFEKLSEYVKNQRDRCVVEVELACGARDGVRNLVVQRHFDSTHESQSKFYMGPAGGKLALAKLDEVKKEMQRLNIQVNNLCVYLAQFRVGLFAELNASDMLAETEKAADPRLFERHMSLKEDVGALRKRREAAAQSRRTADGLQAQVQSMEGDMKAQEERAETETRIEVLKKRLLWCTVDKAHELFERKKAEWSANAMLSTTAAGMQTLGAIHSHTLISVHFVCLCFDSANRWIGRSRPRRLSTNRSRRSASQWPKHTLSRSTQI